MPGHHAHADLEWGFLCSGAMRYRMAGLEHDVPSRRLFVFWGGMPHRSLRPSADATAIVGVVPWRRVLQWGIDGRHRERLLTGSMVAGRDDRHGDDERLLRTWIADLAHPSPARAEQVGLELQARIGRLLLDDGREAASSVPSPAARRMVLALLAEPSLTVAQAARTAGTNAKYVCSAFHVHLGLTPRRWSEVYRVALAQSHLASGQALCATWRLSGFRSPRTFHAAFHAATGLTPASWRLAEQDGASAPHPHLNRQA
jgi:AraC-like DNA-binding protein